MKRFGVIFILFLMVTGFASAKPAYAQTSGTPITQGTAFNPIPSAEDVGATVDQAAQTGQTNKEIYSVNSMAIQMNGVTCFIRGCSRNPQSAFYYGNSAVAGISNVMLAMYTNPPADFMAWIHSTAQDLGFEPKTAYAQGIGFTGLSALLPIWQAFRNISYALLAMVMIIIGFMVMFRKKIDPKTVVTVQNALPKIVLALLLITFSYAIAALMIDLMYLLMAILINLLVSSSGGKLGADTSTKYLSGGIGTTFNALFNGGLSSVDDIFKLIFFNSPQGTIPWYLTLTADVASLGVLPALEFVLVGLIVAIALLFGIIRIAFMLISAYIHILISVLIAPFQLLTEALPGSTGFSSWLKNLVSNLVVFPITAGMLLIGTILTQSNAGRIWTPPLLSGSGANGITGLIGLGILLTIPNVANSVKEALKTKAPVEAGLGAILGPIGGGAGQLMQIGYQASFIKSAFRGHSDEESELAKMRRAAAKPGEDLAK